MKEFILGGVAALLFFIQCICMDFILYLIAGIILVISVGILIEYIILKVKQIHKSFINKQENGMKQVLIRKDKEELA